MPVRKKSNSNFVADEPKQGWAYFEETGQWRRTPDPWGAPKDHFPKEYGDWFAVKKPKDWTPPAGTLAGVSLLGGGGAALRRRLGQRDSQRDGQRDKDRRGREAAALWLARLLWRDERRLLNRPGVPGQGRVARQGEQGDSSTAATAQRTASDIQPALGRVARSLRHNPWRPVFR